MTNPLDDAMESKEAIFGSVASAFRNKGTAPPAGINYAELGQQAAGAAATVAGAAAIAMGIGGVKSLMRAADKRRAFKEMMELEPSLQEHQNERPQLFNAAYNSLHRLNPVYATDPLVSATLMRRMMDSPEGAGTILMGTLKPADQPRPSELGLSVETSNLPIKFRRGF